MKNVICCTDRPTDLTTNTILLGPL